MGFIPSPRGSEATDSWRNGGFHPFQTGDGDGNPIFQPIGSPNLGYNEYLCIYIYMCVCVRVRVRVRVCVCVGYEIQIECELGMVFSTSGIIICFHVSISAPVQTAFLQHPGQRNPMSPTQAMAEICLLALCGGLWHLWGLAGGR